MDEEEEEEKINESLTRVESSQDFKRLTKLALENKSLRRRIKEIENKRWLRRI